MADGYSELEPPAETTTPREVRYEHSHNLVETLNEAGISILVSTYQAGKLVVIGAADEQLELGFHNYGRPMGVAFDPLTNRLAVATKDAVWIAHHDATVARHLPPAGTVGTCFLTRASHLTGDIQAHEIGWANRELWIVNTRFSCLCTLDERNSFVPRWQPSFVDALVAEDRCHLNGLAIADGRPKYVTVLAESNEAEGWRPVKTNAGCLIDVDSHQTIVRGFAMPHSPTVHDGAVYLLNSGYGSLVRVDAAGSLSEIGRFPGYARGLAIHGDLAIVGLSKIRETSTFGGLPISERRGGLKCGVAIVDLATGRLRAQFEFKSGVDEIFDIEVVPRPGRVALRGPYSTEEGQAEIWVVPAPQSSA